MKRTKYIFCLILSLVDFVYGSAQLTQTIRGTVVDPLLQTPVAGATITISGMAMNSIADSAGNFRFRNVPVGRYTLEVSHVGYKSTVFANIVVNTGKEVVLTLSIEANVKTEKEVLVTAGSKKNRPVNDMSIVSARAFTVEETQKYAAAVNDPLRMVTGFAGVAAVDDGGNDIVIRGNSPAGLLWRMEGVDIPNPNHFSNAGSSGGGISILSAQLLSNSDFVTGAFAPEYGNALSGVFDLRLRKGNNEKREYTIEAGLLGLNIAAEGPIAPFYKGSYLVNYRYSTLGILNSVGFKITEGITTFQDLSFNIYLPAGKKGTFTLFGFGGLSTDNDNIETDPAGWQNKANRYGDRFKANTGAIGITHTNSLSSRGTSKSAFSYSYVENISNEAYVHDDRHIDLSSTENYKTQKWTVTRTLNYRLNNQHAFRAGFIFNFIWFGYKNSDKDSVNGPLIERYHTNTTTQTLQGYVQWQYKPMNNLVLTAGAHFLRLQANNSNSFEPRASLKWEIDRKNTLAFGYGLHSQLQALGVYFGNVHDGPVGYSNKNVDFTKAHHWVVSYSRLLGKNFRFKAEVYYQQLFNVPVSIDTANRFSTLNMQDGFVTIPLVNKGKGRNYGLELTLEKNLDNYFYYIINSSFYEAKYTAADGVERDSRFNGKYLFNGVAGKEFPFSGAKKIFGINLKLIYGGGYRFTPADLAASQQRGYSVPDEKHAFSAQLPAYFRPDLRISMKWNRRRLTSTLSLDIQNVINRKNVQEQRYNYSIAGGLTTSINYQNGLIPVLNYKLEF